MTDTVDSNVKVFITVLIDSISTVILSSMIIGITKPAWYIFYVFKKRLFSGVICMYSAFFFYLTEMRKHFF